MSLLLERPKCTITPTRVAWQDLSRENSHPTSHILPSQRMRRGPPRSPLPAGAVDADVEDCASAEGAEHDAARRLPQDTGKIS